MSTDVKVSLVIRTFNEEKHIGKLLSEIAKQDTSFNFETIIVDSGSNDRTLDIVSNFNVRLVRITPEQFTFGRSLNLGIEAALGEFCVMTSAHCYPTHKYWLENIVGPFENKNCSIVYGKQMGINETKYSEQQIFARWFPEVSDPKTKLPFCNNANCAIRRKDWLVRKFDEELTGLEDMDYAKSCHQRGHDIAYRADASVYHIHDETPTQIMNRYYREALAYRAIYKHETFSFTDFLKFFFMNIVGDYVHALQDGVFWKNIFEIPQFRFLQFWGTYKAHRQNKPISQDMQRRIFYPRRPQLFRSRPISQNIDQKISFIDITHPLIEDFPVWPGSIPFEIHHLRNYDTAQQRDSEIKLNVHTGTHIDAPVHFVKDGGDISQISLEQLNGKALVMECYDRKVIDVDYFTSNTIPDDVSRILLKTLNSNNFGAGKAFDKNFVAITAAAADWLVKRQIRVIGIDGPSIQLFHDPNNRTHEILLGANVIIVEGLNLKHAEKGIHKFICMPLKVPKAEGIPARAVLFNGEF
ncbi:MAG: hypothetical protein A2X86_12400 [Bdellovibrionales bacterium GWA2_49_15]|nr:MAG: hypothetical protein A2X86_12400 [Bdellovibrionales bacterium GWA2_49_15]